VCWILRSLSAELGPCWVIERSRLCHVSGRSGRALRHEPSLWDTADLRDMSRKVERWLRENHSELDERAVNAVANTYTFDYK
jgi:hypothetical protein